MNPKIFQSTPPKKNRWPNLFLRRKSQQKLLLFGAASLDFITHQQKSNALIFRNIHSSNIAPKTSSCLHCKITRGWSTQSLEVKCFARGLQGPMMIIWYIYIYRDIHECIHICTSISDIPWVKKNDEEFSTKWYTNPPICPKSPHLLILKKLGKFLKQKRAPTPLEVPWSVLAPPFFSRQNSPTGFNFWGGNLYLMELSRVICCRKTKHLTKKNWWVGFTWFHQRLNEETAQLKETFLRTVSRQFSGPFMLHLQARLTGNYLRPQNPSSFFDEKGRKRNPSRVCCRTSISIGILMRCMKEGPDITRAISHADWKLFLSSKLWN